MKIFTESEAVGNRTFDVSDGDLVRLNDGREVVRVKHSMRDQDNDCRRNSGESCTFVNDKRLLRAHVVRQRNLP